MTRFFVFFGEKSSVADLAAGVEKFQESAMLCFGNFIYAFRRLARIDHEANLRRELGDFGRASKDVVDRVVSKDRKLTNCFWNFYRNPVA